MFGKILKGLSIATGAGYAMHKFIYETQREHEIKTKEGIAHTEDLVKESSEFEEIGKPAHGTLPASFVKHKDTGKEYVKKGAHTRDDLVKEFMIANALHEITPDQPECLIMQTKNDKGFQYHSLSRKFDNTQDVEEFVRQGKTDLLTKKEVVGLEGTLITDQVFGKQSDTKLANMLVRETPEQLIFTSIDHERAVTPTGFRFFQPSTPRYPTDKSTLIQSIHDLGEQSEENHAGLASDPRAKEFGKVAESIMDDKKINNYYKKIAATNLNPILEQCHRLAISSNNGLVKQRDCDGYELFFKEMQKMAQEHVKNTDQPNNSATPF